MVKIIIELAESQVGGVVSYLMGLKVGKVSVESSGVEMRRAGRHILDYCPTVEAVRLGAEVSNLSIPPQQREIMAYILINEKATALELVNGLGMKLTAVHSALQKLRHTDPPLVESKERVEV